MGRDERRGYGMERRGGLKEITRRIGGNNKMDWRDN